MKKIIECKIRDSLITVNFLSTYLKHGLSNEPDIHRKGMIKIKLGKEIIMYENSHVKHSDIEKQ